MNGIQFFEKTGLTENRLFSNYDKFINGQLTDTFHLKFIQA